MQLLGYSERGAINSLFYSISHCSNSGDLLTDFLSRVAFPFADVALQVMGATALIDQSFSDFGSADVVLLLETRGAKRAVFMEAKVKTAQKPCWRVFDEFEALEKGIQKGKTAASNLFIQLYYKVRLTTALESGGLTKLQRGVAFPKCCGKAKTVFRTIGTNPVVLGAVRRLEQYCQDALFVALLPEEEGNLKTFYEDKLRGYRPPSFQEWETSNWGYLTWRQVEHFCRAHNLQQTLQVLEFNAGQIY